MSNYKNVKLFYIGHLDEHSNSYKRFLTYKSLVDVKGFMNIDEIIYRGITRRIDHYLNFGLGSIKLNFLLRKVKVEELDVLLIDNRPFVFSSTLKNFRKRNPSLKIISVITDDPFGKYNKGWRLLKKTCSLFDLHFVQRSANINELYKYGSRKVEICYRSYDSNFHKRIPNSVKNSQFDVEFVGSYEEERCESIIFLLKNGIRVGVTGDGWEKSQLVSEYPNSYLGPAIYGVNYIEKLNSISLALHFLRRANRDEQDSRTFEIPACGTPVIAEFSNVHAQLFTENTEMLYFRNNIDLLEKVRILLENPDSAKKMADAALMRSVNSGYSHENRIRKILDQIFFNS
jgi:spore maturation protein CgeB